MPNLLCLEMPVEIEAFKSQPGENDTLVIEGWLSTSKVFPRTGRFKWKVIPEAFTPAVIAEFMVKPILCFSHNLDTTAIGKVLSVDVRPGEGVWIRAVVLGTREGQDVQTLIRGGAINSFSFMFYTARETVERSKDANGEESYMTIIEELERLIECSVCNLGRNEGAIFKIADNQKFAYIPSSADGGEVNSNKTGGNMTDEEKKKLAEEFASQKSVSGLQTSIDGLKTEVGELGKLTEQLKTFREDVDRTAAENKTFVEKLSADFKAAVEAFTTGQAAILERSVPYGSAAAIQFSMAEVMAMPERRLKGVFTENRFCQIENVRRCNDNLLLVDAIKMKSNDDEYKSRPFKDRIHDLKLFRELQGHRRAFAIDTATSDEGSEYLPTGYSSRMAELVRIDSVVFNMHPSFPMTNSIQVLPVEGSDTIATLEGEKTTVVSAFNATEQTPGSANVTFTAKKARGRTQWSGEADEDLIVSMSDYVEMKVARSIRRAIARATISGDLAGGTGYDSGDVPGSTDYRYGMDGYREGILAASKVDLSTFSEKNLNKVQAAGGKYMQMPSEFYWLMSIKGYLLHMMDPDEVSSCRTVDKYGPQATVVTGELAKYNGAPIVIDEWILDTFDNTGVYSAAGQTKSIILCVNRNSWMYGLYKPITVEIVRDAHNDVYDVIARQRLQIQSLFDVTAEPTVTLGYNVATT